MVARSLTTLRTKRHVGPTTVRPEEGITVIVVYPNNHSYGRFVESKERFDQSHRAASLSPLRSSPLPQNVMHFATVLETRCGGLLNNSVAPGPEGEVHQKFCDDDKDVIPPNAGVAQGLCGIEAERYFIAIPRISQGRNRVAYGRE